MQTGCAPKRTHTCSTAFFILIWRFLIRSLQNIFSQSFTTKCRFSFSVVRQNSMFCRLRSKDSIFFAIIQVKISLLSAFFCFISGLDALRLEFFVLCHIIHSLLCHEMSYQMAERKIISKYSCREFGCRTPDVSPAVDSVPCSPSMLRSTSHGRMSTKFHSVI